MSIPHEDFAKILVAKLTSFKSGDKEQVRIGDIAKELGLEENKIRTNIKAGKIQTLAGSSSELNKENAERLIERLLDLNPGIEDKFISEISPEASKLKPDPKSIIENDIIVDGSNVLYWMLNNKQDNKVNLIPLLIILSKVKQNGFNFCCIFDAKSAFEIHEKQPEQSKEFKKLWEKYPNNFTVVTGGTSADDFILLNANSSKRKVLSNDRFRDNPIHLPKSQFIRGGLVMSQIQLLAPLNIVEPLILDLRKAVRDLETELKK